MRPDEHKAKDSRRYQQRKKHQGDATAAEIAEARRRSARARDTGTSIAAIRRRNGELPPPSHANSEKPASSSFSRRKIVSNVDRYKERTLQDELEEDAELGIDRETTNLVAMLDESETSGNAYFKFKEEQMWDNDAIVQEDIYRSMLEINFDMFEGDLQALDTSTLLDLRSEDKVMVDTALNQVPVLLEKPIVPAFQKNAKGYVLFKSPMVTEIKESPSQHGIYLRNDGSNHRVI
ncbi:uncharacterized protein BYT42DRAFT_483803, partial [Radiomyces spectabilis]|uniref:uncharacterized protein n=1 Tax=Radiomyces spectabilis TaxID=64574 RepID=UPI00221FA05E